MCQLLHFLFTLKKSLNLKRDFNSHWVLISGSVMFTKNRVLFLTVLKLFTTEYKFSVVQLEKYC